jgi:hypothetical protein
LGQEWNEKIRLESNETEKIVTLTLDRKDRKEKDLPGPYLAAITVGVALMHVIRTNRATCQLAGPSMTAGVRDRAIGSTTDPLDGGALTLG